jgi:hypothetical protein
MLYPKGSQNAGTQRIQITSRPAKVRRITGTRTMAVKLSSSHQNTRGLKGNSNVKFAATPHRRSTVLVKQVTRRFHQKLGRARVAIHKQLPINVHTTSVNRGSEIMCTEKWRGIALIHTTLERNKKTQQKMSPTSEQ